MSKRSICSSIVLHKKRQKTAVFDSWSMIERYFTFADYLLMGCVNKWWRSIVAGLKIPKFLHLEGDDLDKIPTLHSKLGHPNVIIKVAGDAGLNLWPSIRKLVLNNSLHRVYVDLNKCPRLKKLKVCSWNRYVGGSSSVVELSTKRVECLFLLARSFPNLKRAKIRVVDLDDFIMDCERSGMEFGWRDLTLTVGVHEVGLQFLKSLPELRSFKVVCSSLAPLMPTCEFPQLSHLHLDINSGFDFILDHFPNLESLVISSLAEINLASKKHPLKRLVLQEMVVNFDWMVHLDQLEELEFADFVSLDSFISRGEPCLVKCVTLSQLVVNTRRFHSIFPKLETLNLRKESSKLKINIIE